MKNSLNFDFEKLNELKKVFKYKLKKKFEITVIITALLIILIGINPVNLNSQNASPSNWLYPEGNLQSTLNNPVTSVPQIIDSFSVKWSTPYISGDVKPLIGNIVVNQPLLDFLYEPNEIVAVMGDEIVLISGTGSLLKRSRFPNYVNGIKGVSCLIDTNMSSVNNAVIGPVIIGMEGIEQFNPLDKDSLAYSYLFGFSSKLDSIIPMKRLAINLRPFQPNIFASIKPIFGKRVNNRLMVYSTVNMNLPKVLDPTQIEPPFFRGLAQFYDYESISSFPLPDIKDDINYRAVVGPEVNIGQPSVYSYPGTEAALLLPTYPTPDFVDPNYNSMLISALLDGEYLDSYMDIASLIGLKINNTAMSPAFVPYEIIPEDGSRPLIRPYYLDITDAGSGNTGFILVAEQYNGMDGSVGVSKLHLHDLDGNPLTEYLPGSEFNPYFQGDTNHYWGVAIGNVDGIDTNNWLPYFPNNPGKEIIVTQTSRDFAYPGSKLSILRYYTGPEIEKPSPNGDYLYTLDTICTQRINGWIACVNDLDNSGDLKEEIVLADGSKLMIIRMRNYQDYRFRLGYPFDTLFVKEFFNQKILHVSVADLEGDGKNDIIVTTDDSTYVIGSVISNTLSIIEPNKSAPITNICADDTLEIKWKNIIYSQDKVDLYFIDLTSGLPDTVLIKSNISNSADTIKYSIIADTSLVGKNGAFLVVGSSKPQLLSDYSGLVQFNPPIIDLNSIAFNKSDYKPFDEIIVSGSVSCSDSIFMEVKIDSTSWQYISSDSIPNGINYNINGIMPCLPDYFKCDASYSDTLVNFRLISVKGSFSDTLDNIFLRIKPVPFPIEFDTTQIADPTMYFTWDTSKIDTNIDCTTLEMYYSDDDGFSFQPIGSVPIEDEILKWNVPVNINDTLIFRFCCSGICVRTDTLITGVKYTYLKIIAPNPFFPDKEELQIVYDVPEDLTVTIKILDQNNRLVAEPVKSQSRKKGIVYGDYWNGIRYDGAVCAIGMYYVVLELSNGVKEIYPVYIRK